MCSRSNWIIALLIAASIWPLLCWVGMSCTSQVKIVAQSHDNDQDWGSSKLQVASGKEQVTESATCSLQPATCNLQLPNCI